jgi:hypothetical protein
VGGVLGGVSSRAMRGSFVSLVAVAAVSFSVVDVAWGVGCPPEGERAKVLGVEGGGWVTDCRREGRGFLLVGFLPPEGKAEPPQVVVVLGRAGGPGKRGAFELASAQEPRLREITPAAEQWTVRVDRSKLGRENLVRVTLAASWGGNLLYDQQIVSLVRETPDGLARVWTGLGDWKENRFDICLLSARASFRLAGGKLERVTRVQRRRGPAPIDEAPARQVQKECETPPPRRDTFDLPPGAPG